MQTIDHVLTTLIIFGSIFSIAGITTLLVFPERRKTLTEEEIVYRSRKRQERLKRIRQKFGFFLALAIVTFLSLLLPIHTWLHRHLQFLAGILIGSLLELMVYERQHIGEVLSRPYWFLAWMYHEFRITRKP